jgi:hypothetical protein
MKGKATFCVSGVVVETVEVAVAAENQLVTSKYRPYFLVVDNISTFQIL